jgi:hypothetical protein
MGGTGVWFREFPKKIPPFQWAAALPDNDRSTEPIEMISASITALMTMNLLAAGQPLSTEVLTSNQPACVARDAQLNDWKREGLEPFGAQAGGWCVAAIFRSNVYEAVQWRHASNGSEGYRIRLVLNQPPRTDRSGTFEIGLGIHGASMTVTPITAHVPLMEDHRRHIEGRFGPRPRGSRSSEGSSGDRPYAVTRLIHREHIITVVSLVLASGERFRVELKQDVTR